VPTGLVAFTFQVSNRATPCRLSLRDRHENLTY